MIHRRFGPVLMVVAVFIYFKRDDIQSKQQRNSFDRQLRRILQAVDVASNGCPPPPWILSYPHSGSSFVSYLLNIGNSCSSTNGDGIPPAYETHCSGIGTWDVPPSEYIITPEQFWEGCQYGSLLPTPTTIEMAPADTKVLHMIRNPMDVVVARFHNLRERANAEGVVFPFADDARGFHEWCAEADERFLDEELAAYPTPVFAASFRIACHSEFFKLVQWHNNALAALRGFAGRPYRTYHYGSFHADYGNTARSLLLFVGRPQGGRGLPDWPKFRFQSFSRIYYAARERRAIGEFCRLFANDEAWKEWERYFSSSRPGEEEEEGLEDGGVKNLYNQFFFEEETIHQNEGEELKERLGG